MQLLPLTALWKANLNFYRAELKDSDRDHISKEPPNRVFLTNGPAPRVSEEILALRRRAGSQGLRNIQPREAYKYLAV